MNKLFTVLLIVCLAFASHAQRNEKLPVLFTVDEVQDAGRSSVGMSEKMERIRNNPMNREVRKMRFTNLAKTVALNQNSNAGHFRFTIPKSKGRKKREVLVSPVKIEALPSGDYTYIADLYTGRNGKGTLILTQEDENRFGSIYLEDRVFRMEQTDEGEQILIELNQELLNAEAACATDHKSGPKKKLDRTLTDQQRTNASRIVRVLVLFTDRADDISNPGQLATTLMNELTTSLSNTRIYSSTLRFQLVGTQRIGYDETGNAETDLDNLVADNDLNNRRQNANADLVVVLTDGNYFTPFGQILGIATLDEYTQPNDGHVAIVEADAGNVTFAHEVGHLMGCRHDNDSRTNVANLSDTAKGHNWFYRNWFLGPKKYQKSVVASGGTQGSRVLYFSNPAVKAHSKARDNTGTSTRNNFEQLRDAAPVVGCYIDFDDMTVSISGPSAADPGQTITMSSSVQNCASRTYRWEVSTDGFTYNFIGSGSSVNYTVLPLNNQQSVSFRLTVTCSDGQVRTAFRSVFVFGDCDDPFTPCLLRSDEDSEPTEAEPEVESQPIAATVLYPNPSGDEVTLAFSAPVDSDIEVVAYSMITGRKHKLYRGKSKTENNHLDFDLSRFDQGLYQVVITLDGSRFDEKKLIIKR